MQDFYHQQHVVARPEFEGVGLKECEFGVLGFAVVLCILVSCSGFDFVVSCSLCLHRC